MSTQPHTEPRAGDAAVAVFTPQGLRVLDALADVLVNRMAKTPEGIARVLDEVLHAPLDDLCCALDAVHAGLDARHPTKADKPARAGVVYADGWRQQLPGTWPHYPDEPHHCYTAGHWTRDGSQLVLACCGLDAT